MGQASSSTSVEGLDAAAFSTHCFPEAYAEGNPDFLVGDEVLVSDTTTGVVVEVVPHAAPPRITLRMHGFAWDCRFAMA